MSDILIGVIGPGDPKAGSGRGGFVANVCRVLGGSRVAAIYDIVEPNAQAAAARIDGCRGFGGPDQWEAFLASGITAVVVASPVPFHVSQSVACLDRGLHVLCEVIPATSMDEARDLLAAVKRSKATYMLAENCNFLNEVELVRRMADAGALGDLYHAESTYLHDCKYLWYNPDGSLTWRGQGKHEIYCTHSLGPVLYVLKDRIAQVSCLALTKSIYDPKATSMANFSMQMRTAAGRTVLVRVDAMSPRPYALEYKFQGTKGVYEFTYGVDKQPRISIAGDHKWHLAGEDEMKQYAPDRLDLPAAAAEVGHGSMEYWMMKAWLGCLRAGRPMPLDIHAALDATLPGIVGKLSAAAGGAVMQVPDLRNW